MQNQADVIFVGGNYEIYDGLQEIGHEDHLRHTRKVGNKLRNVLSTSRGQIALQPDVFLVAIDPANLWFNAVMPLNGWETTEKEKFLQKQIPNEMTQLLLRSDMIQIIQIVWVQTVISTKRKSTREVRNMDAPEKDQILLQIVYCYKMLQNILDSENELEKK
jgi:hypothetical protein